jgi:hypothetical protein
MLLVSPDTTSRRMVRSQVAPAYVSDAPSEAVQTRRLPPHRRRSTTRQTPTCSNPLKPGSFPVEHKRCRHLQIDPQPDRRTNAPVLAVVRRNAFDVNSPIRCPMLPSRQPDTHLPERIPAKPAHFAAVSHNRQPLSTTARRHNGRVQILVPGPIPWFWKLLVETVGAGWSARRRCRQPRIAPLCDCARPWRSRRDH